jgi:hypothetical protein
MLEHAEREAGMQHVLELPPTAASAYQLERHIEAHGYAVFVAEAPEEPQERRWRAVALCYDRPVAAYSGESYLTAVATLAGELGLSTRKGLQHE